MVLLRRRGRAIRAHRAIGARFGFKLLERRLIRGSQLRLALHLDGRRLVRVHAYGAARDAKQLVELEHLDVCMKHREQERVRPCTHRWGDGASKVHAGVAAKQESTAALCPSMMGSC